MILGWSINDPHWLSYEILRDPQWIPSLILGGYQIPSLIIDDTNTDLLWIRSLILIRYYPRSLGDNNSYPWWMPSLILGGYHHISLGCTNTHSCWILSLIIGGHLHWFLLDSIPDPFWKPSLIPWYFVCTILNPLWVQFRIWLSTNHQTEGCLSSETHDSLSYSKIILPDYWEMKYFTIN